MQNNEAETVISFGKYSGKSIEQIAQLDWDYLCWMSHERIVRGGVNFSKIANQYVAAHEDEHEIEVCPVCHETSCDGWHWNGRR